MEWLAKDIWTGSYEEDDIMRLTIAMELSFNLPHGRCCYGERPLSWERVKLTKDSKKYRKI